MSSTVFDISASSLIIGEGYFQSYILSKSDLSDLPQSAVIDILPTTNDHNVL
jgi:hypothetical protein